MHAGAGSGAQGHRWLLGRLLPLLTIGTLVLAAPVRAQEGVPRGPSASVRLAGIATGYRLGGRLGFVLRDTALEEAVYRRRQGPEQGLLWSARFVSRWPLTEDQLDRWSAQVIGLLADQLSEAVRPDGWQRLAADDIGEVRVAYRYTLVPANGTPPGEATVVVFGRGAEVGLSATAALGADSPIDGVALTRLMDTAGSHD